MHKTDFVLSIRLLQGGTLGGCISCVYYIYRPFHYMHGENCQGEQAAHRKRKKSYEPCFVAHFIDGVRVMKYGLSRSYI